MRDFRAITGTARRVGTAMTAPQIQAMTVGLAKCEAARTAAVEPPVTAMTTLVDSRVVLRSTARWLMGGRRTPGWSVTGGVVPVRGPSFQEGMVGSVMRMAVG